MKYLVSRISYKIRNSKRFLSHDTRYTIHDTVHQKGFTLLIAALVASIVLSIGAAVFAIAQKQIALSSAGRNSQFAFYTADTAAECALYWDVRDQYFAATTTYNGAVACDGQNITASVVSGTRASGNFAMSFSYQITITPPAPDTTRQYCANVLVTKSQDPVTNAVTSVIHADGFSTPCATVSTDSNALQRSVELRY